MRIPALQGGAAAPRKTAVFVALLMVFAVATGGRALAMPTYSALQAAMVERASFGLPADQATVIEILASGLDIGTAKWGIVMTAAEDEAIDLGARMDFFLNVDRDVLPFAQAAPTYAGAYIDQPNGGGLVVLLTAHDTITEAGIRVREPQVSRGIQIRYVDRSYAVLEAAAYRARDVIGEQVAVQIHGVGLDIPSNSLTVEVEPADIPILEGLRGTLENRLGVRVLISAGKAAIEQVCTSRDRCYDPHKAGIYIHRSSVTGAGCTMGFHVRSGTDEQFVSAGHCGHGGVYSWYHAGNGYIGQEVASQYSQGGRDAHRVQMDDSQASDDIFNDSPNIVGAGNPLTGMAICASMGFSGFSNPIDCGTVSTNLTSWTGGLCGCTIWGADAASIFGQEGDSGSPLYVIGGGSSEPATGYGIWNTGSGGFARLGDVLSLWNVVIVT